MPPARKLASWPLMVTRFGSARILTRLSFFWASMAMSNGRLLALLPKNAAEAPVSSDVTSPPVQEPKPPCRFTAEPSWFSSVLETSATFTSSMTCCGVSTDSMFSTPPFLAASPCAALAYAWAISMACCAAWALVTLPVSTRLSAAVITRMPGSPGNSWPSEVCSPPASAFTTTLMMLQEPLRPCTIMLVVPTARPST
ncbi:hypothetical protein D9M72_470140 [compost metagenome]